MIDFSKDYYKVLELEPGVQEDQIKLAYRKQVKRYHPDLYPGNMEFENKIREINEAYEILSNPDDRSIYDQYLKTQGKNPITSSRYENNTRTYTRTTIVDVETRTYLKGMIFIKYRGFHVDADAENILRETFYRLNITQIDAEVFSESMYSSEQVPLEFKNVFDTHKPFHLNIKQPINCQVHTENGIEYYKLDVLDLTIPHSQIINVTKHEGESFGILTGQFYGYIVKKEKHELVTEVTECFGETGRREEREENGRTAYRKQYFNTDCTTYWGQWVEEVLRDTYVPTGKTETKGDYVRSTYYKSNYKTTYTGNWVYKQPAGIVKDDGCLGSVFGVVGSILAILFFLFLLPNLIFLLPFILLPFLLNLLPIRFWSWLSSAIVWLICGFYIFVLAFTIINHKRNRVQQTTNVPKPKPIESTLVPVVEKESKDLRLDTLITHTMSWDDYDGKTYSGSFWISKNHLNKAHIYKNELPISVIDERSYDEAIFSLKEFDKANLRGLYKMFDSLRISNKLTVNKFAEVIVSFVQTIPYTIILPNSCNSKFYEDEFTTKYLSSKNARCDGNERFGINTPVEFLSSLNGDCDTRTLLLYTVLDHYKYDVTLLSSDYYSHSIIGVNLPYDGITYNYNNQRYILWETTALNAKPGILPNEISNTDYWRISLKSK